MIHCTINGKVAYPSTSEKIKVTYANQFIEDSGTYTYDISFPMSVHANQVVFNNVHRFDVHKRITAFDDCKLYVDNRLIIDGKGTVTSVTESKLKLQIVGGKSRIKYNSNFERHFIDEIDYPKVYVTCGIDRAVYGVCGVDKLDMEKWSSISVDLTTKNFVGCPGVAAFNPINDETAGYIVNQIINVYLNWIKVNGIKYDINRRTARMNSLAVQPYLLYVLKEVLRYEGYTIERNDFDCEPWNRILIASVNITSKIAGALPHWSVYTFIDEVRKLFNASFIFDETNKKVKILSTNEMTSNDYVVYDCLDEYSTEYNEDGVVTMATANVEYDFYDSAERDWREYVPQDVLRNYPTKEYSTKEALTAAAMAMGVRERRSTIFKVDNDLYIYGCLRMAIRMRKTRRRSVCGAVCSMPLCATLTATAAYLCVYLPWLFFSVKDDGAILTVWTSYLIAGYASQQCLMIGQAVRTCLTMSRARSLSLCRMRCKAQI